MIGGVRSIIRGRVNWNGRRSPPKQRAGCMSDRQRFEELLQYLSTLSDEELGASHHSILVAELIQAAPDEVRGRILSKFEEFFGQLPEPALRGENGEKLWTEEQLARFMGVDKEEVRQRVHELVENGIDVVYEGKATWSN